MTPTEALRQCVEAMKEVDFADCGKDDARWHKLNAAQQVAEEVLKRPEQEPVAYLRFRAAQQWSGSGNSDIEYNEWLEACHSHEVGDDKLPAFPVYAAPVAAQQAVAQIATPVGVGEEGETTSDYSAMRLRLIAEKLGLGNAIPEKNADLWACAFSVLGMIRREVEKLVTQPAAAPSGDAALKFADHIINGMFEGGDWDGGDVQELAVKYGLLKPETMQGPCNEDGACQCAQNSAEFPSTCYRKTYATKE